MQFDGEAMSTMAHAVAPFLEGEGPGAVDVDRKLSSRAASGVHGTFDGEPAEGDGVIGVAEAPRRSMAPDAARPTNWRAP